MNPNEPGTGDPLSEWVRGRREAFEHTDLTFEVMASIRSLGDRAPAAWTSVRLPYLEAPCALLGILRAALLFFFILVPVQL